MCAASRAERLVGLDSGGGAQDAQVAAAANLDALAYRLRGSGPGG